MPEKTFYLLSLGCPKNSVDSDIIISSLSSAGWRAVESPHDAAAILINTCSFITAAVEESLDAVLELSDLRSHGERWLVVTGCLVYRYGVDTLRSLLPEVDLLVGVDGHHRMAASLDGLAGWPELVPCAAAARSHSATLSRGYVYLKISEGCGRGCSYCTIPCIRGPLASRPWEEIQDEARFFLAQGAGELVLVAQDTTSYGLDLYGKPSLPMLLDTLSDIDGEWRIRVMYMHPEGIDDELMAAMGNGRVCAYLDLPFQHVDEGVLERMGRRGSLASHRRLIDLARETADEVALRATFMVGFPGEDGRAFAALYDFIAEACFDWLGLFSYSHEEGTPAFSLDDRVTAAIARTRLEEIVELQEEIMLDKASGMAGREMRVMLEGESAEAKGFWEARSWREAPEVDGVIFVPHEEGMSAGAFQDVVIAANEGVDLIGDLQARREQPG